MFLAYELAYWLDHALSHKVPVLWEFHKVHHTAEVLTPLTVFRVHPIDTLVFANISALVLGLTGAGLQHLLGSAAAPFALSGSNVVLVGFVFLTVHLQHSHVWISFRGLAGRVFLSPAHHQIHHSADPIHFNRNFGSCLSVWDWLFGTLCLPAKRREALTFGAEVRAGAASPHSVAGVLLAPFGRRSGYAQGCGRRSSSGPSRLRRALSAAPGASRVAASGQSRASGPQPRSFNMSVADPRSPHPCRRLEAARDAEVANRDHRVAAGLPARSSRPARRPLWKELTEDHVEPLVREGGRRRRQAKVELRVAPVGAQPMAGGRPSARNGRRRPRLKAAERQHLRAWRAEADSAPPRPAAGPTPTVARYAALPPPATSPSRPMAPRGFSA